MVNAENSAELNWWRKPLSHWFPPIRERQEQVFLLLTIVLASAASWLMLRLLLGNHPPFQVRTLCFQKESRHWRSGWHRVSPAEKDLCYQDWFLESLSAGKPTRFETFSVSVNDFLQDSWSARGLGD